MVKYLNSTNVTFTMETLHTYHDGSKLYKISARALLQVPIWKGNRIIDLTHVANIKKSVQNNVMLLDSGYKTIQYMEHDQDNKPIMKTYVIDGQHRLSVIGSYFETEPNANDFFVTMTQIKVDSEADVIDYFNKINNVKPIQFEEDPKLLVNRYLQAVMNHCNKNTMNVKLIRSGGTKRPYLSLDRFREVLEKKVHELKNIPVNKFVSDCMKMNDCIVSQLKTDVFEKRNKDCKLIEKMIQLEFALAWDDKYRWVDHVLTNG